MNTELVKALRYCKECEVCNEDASAECPYEHHWTDGEDCQRLLLADAADALKAAEKRIKELESQAAFFDAEKLNYKENIEYRDERIKELEDDLRNGTISNIDRFKVYDYTVRDLILFADMCKRNDVREADLKQAAWNLELAVRAVQNERMEIVKKWSDEMSNGISVRLIPDFEKAYEEMRGENDGK